MERLDLTELTEPAGSVLELWRYPVKSMLGEPSEALELNARGVVGDRLFAVVDALGKLGSGKTTRRFFQLAGLLDFQAVAAEPLPLIRFPDGRLLGADDPGVHAALSEAFGQPLTLARETNTAHLDAGPIHLLTTAALAWLKTTLPEAATDPRRFRPNLVIETPGSGQVEHDWLGKILCIGSDVRLRVQAPTKRCVMVTLAQQDLAHDASVLRAIAQHADANFGVYADVLVPGRIQRQDRVLVVAS